MNITRDDKGVAHIIALSGGKDSTAMAVLLTEREPRPYTFICTPTGDELPEMFKHWNALSMRFGKRIYPIVIDKDLNGLIASYNALPNWRQRWCTRKLKIEPFQAFMAYVVKNGPCVSYVGLRADEPDREGGDYSAVNGATLRFPLREWGMTINDVLKTLEDRKICVPERTDCARCFFQTLGEWYSLWKKHPEIYADAEQQEIKIGHTFRSPSRDTWPAALRDLRKEFEKGRIPRGVDLNGDALSNAKCRVCRI